MPVEEDLPGTESVAQVVSQPAGVLGAVGTAVADEYPVHAGSRGGATAESSRIDECMPGTAGATVGHRTGIAQGPIDAETLVRTITSAPIRCILKLPCGPASLSDLKRPLFK